MPELIAKSALGGRKPLTLAATTLAEVDPGPITAILPFVGQEKQMAQALAPLEFHLPTPNSLQIKGDAMLVWTGRDQAFLIGIACPEMPAARVDQTDGWASLTLSGPMACDALARYVPLDLRLSAFPTGTCARSALYHMPMILIRLSDQSFRIMVFRSMAQTAWHELALALKTLAARSS